MSPMGCANSKQVDPAKPEPGSVAFAEADAVVWCKRSRRWGRL